MSKKKSNYDPDKILGSESPGKLLSGLSAKLKQPPKDTAPHLIVQALAGAPSRPG